MSQYLIDRIKGLPNVEVVTGAEIARLEGEDGHLSAATWRDRKTGADAGAERRPLETSRRGVFAIGDVRAGSIKRVAASVGEGAQVVATLHAHLAAPAAQ